MVWSELKEERVSFEKGKGRKSELTLKNASAYRTTVNPLARREVSARGGMGVRKG